MRRKKSNLDEMQEQELLKVEHNGCWIAFWGLLAAIIIQSILFGSQDCIARNGCTLSLEMSRIIAMMATTNAMISGKPVIPDLPSYCILSQIIIRI